MSGTNWEVNTDTVGESTISGTKWEVTNWCNNGGNPSSYYAQPVAMVTVQFHPKCVVGNLKFDYLD